MAAALLPLLQQGAAVAAPNGAWSKLNEALRRERRQAPGESIDLVSHCWITEDAVARAPSGLHCTWSIAANAAGKYDRVRTKAASTISSTRWRIPEACVRALDGVVPRTRSLAL